MQISTQPMGNSRGALIPQPILEQTGPHDTTDLQANSGVIEIRPIQRNPREGWAADSQRIAQTGDDALAWPEFSNADDKGLQW